MSNPYFFPSKIRVLISDALPEDTSLHGGSPELRYTYLPLSHRKALQPNNMLVMGIRGSGKSFWWSALQMPKHREKIGKNFGLDKETVVSKGFGEKPAPEDYPGKDTLSLLCRSFDGRLIWRTVVFKHVCGSTAPKEFKSLREWKQRVQWLKTNPEQVENFLYQADKASKKHHIVLFDALDRTADDWKTMNILVSGLLQAALDFRVYDKIRLKIFARPDQVENTEVLSFPDSSKIISEKAELSWPRNELYGLLWQHLANVDDGKIFRDGCQKLILNLRWDSSDGLFTVPEPLRSDEENQRTVFHAMTGPWMGRDRRRGFPYTWLPNHLGDTRKQVSPRSFLAAVRHATADKVREGHLYALHYESIKRGVQEASRIRVREIKEDYPWVDQLFAVLSELNVPCSADEIKNRWKQRRVLAELNKKIKNEKVQLPPAHIDSGPDGVLEDLERLGLIERLPHDRINMPDVYRVGYGIGRRGGVKPAARG